ncbi:MAG: VOC family protein [Steroidobacteraceae bacterium]
MPQFIAYLGFDGTCAEAMRFYETTFGGKLAAMIRFADMPDAGEMPPAVANRIMHANLVLDDGSSLMAGDAPANEPFAGMRGCMLAMSYPEIDVAQRIFDALAKGGRVTMPMQETFWAQRFGMLTDRYGTSWAINGAPKPM